MIARLPPLRLFVLTLMTVTAVAFVSLWARTAFAASEVVADLDAEVVGLGDAVTLTLNATSDGAAVTSPDPGAPPSLRVTQTSSGPMHSISIVNGVRTERRGVRATFSLTPTKLGTVTIRPSALIGGARFKSRPLTLRVVAAGAAPRPHGRTLPPTPFDPFKGLIDDFDVDEFIRGRAGAPVTADPSLAMVQAPRAKTAFLHARADKASAVVGEQITYSVYLYVDAEQSEPRYDDVHEAGVKDFLRMSILPEDQAPKMLGHTTLGGRIWAVKLLRRHALFPLRAGRLPIAPMQLRVSSGRSASTRESERLFVDVSEPTAGGRPPGYVLGDVGKMKLTATVSPRETDVSGSVTVEVELEGTGNLPQSLTPPPRKGVEWLPPDIRSKVAPDGSGKVGGARTFVFVVRAREPGAIDLGELSLPFYDAEAGKYDVARAPLGTLTVRGAANASANDAARNVLSGLPKALTAPQPPAERSRSFVEARSFFFAWLTPPTLFFAYLAGSLLVARLRARKTEVRTTPKSQLKAAQAAVDDALERGDAQAADAAIRKLVEAVVDLRLGLAIRAIDLERLARSLREAGAEDATAAEIVRILREAEAARFAPGGASLDDARTRAGAAKRALERLPIAAKVTAAAAAALVLFLCSSARAEGESFVKAATALEQGKPEIAIGELEVLADRGVIDAHASFDRGLAYAERVRLGGGQTGDLGRAVHGFEEARRLSNDTALQREAERALQLIRAEIARQRARGEAVELESRSFSETLARLMSASGWGVLACVASLLASFAAAAAFRLRGREESAARRVQAGAVIALCIAAPLSIGSAYFGRDRALDRERSWAVVIAPETRTLAAGRVNSVPMPEGAIVEVTKMEAGRVEVRWGADREWLSRAGVRLLVASR